jgi:hypothetical protein
MKIGVQIPNNSAKSAFQYRRIGKPLFRGPSRTYNTKRVFPDEQDGDRVTPNDGARGGARVAVDDFSQVAPVETVSSSDGRGWRGVRVLRFRHTETCPKPLGASTQILGRKIR